MLLRGAFCTLLSRRIGFSLMLAGLLTGTVCGRAWSQSSEPADTTKIIIGQSSGGGPAALPLYIAVDQGFFKKAGIDVTSQALSGGSTSAAAAFVNGSVNMLNSSAPELIQYTGKRLLSGKAFAEVTDQSYDILVGKGITKFEDIKGKTIGVSAINGADYIYLVAIMQHYGLSPTDVTFISSGSPVNRVAAVSSGVVQVTAQSNALREESLKAGTILLKSGDSPISFPSNMYIANEDLIRNHKPLLKKFATVLSDTATWMKANPDAAVTSCMRTISATTEACASAIRLSFDKSMSSQYTWSSTFAINIEGIKSALAVMAKIDPDTRNVTIDDVVDTSITGTTP